MQRASRHSLNVRSRRIPSLKFTISEGVAENFLVQCEHSVLPRHWQPARSGTRRVGSSRVVAAAAVRECMAGPAFAKPVLLRSGPCPLPSLPPSGPHSNEAPRQSQPHGTPVYREEPPRLLAERQLGCGSHSCSGSNGPFASHSTYERNRMAAFPARVHHRRNASAGTLAPRT